MRLARHCAATHGEERALQTAMTQCSDLVKLHTSTLIFCVGMHHASSGNQTRPKSTACKFTWPSDPECHTPSLQSEGSASASSNVFAWVVYHANLSTGSMWPKPQMNQKLCIRLSAFWEGGLQVRSNRRFIDVSESWILGPRSVSAISIQTYMPLK